MRKKILFSILVGIGVSLAILACSKHYFRSNYKNANALLHETDTLDTKPYLKAHLKNGNVCILKDSWKVDTLTNFLSGNGSLYNFNREKVSEGKITIPIDSVAIFETNSKIKHPEFGRILALSILTGLDVALGVYCITNPKSCFGSCPTFYIDEDINFHYADAEGFSNAIAPSMEYYDIDALNNEELSQQTFSITMKNEALETHCVNNVKLLAYPRKKGERIYHSPSDDFYLCGDRYPLKQAIGNEGNVTALLSNEDMQERFSLSDEKNLSSKEEIILTFDTIENSTDLGLIVSFRQTLMTTYFIYSAIDYMGDEVGDIFAQLELNDEPKDKLKNGIKKELGNIDVYLWNEQADNWELQGGLYETGPIAINKQFIPLKNRPPASNVKIKLVLNKGLWRMDYVALTTIKKKVEPVEIDPFTILHDGEEDRTALAKFSATEQHLIAMPGSEYKLNFKLPKKNTDYELFLYSKGYYLEWMRAQWIKDKNLPKLKQMLEKPKKYLSSEAENYKLYEATMEEEFWNSKIDTKSFSYNEK